MGLVVEAAPRALARVGIREMKDRAHASGIMTAALTKSRTVTKKIGAILGGARDPYALVKTSLRLCSCAAHATPRRHERQTPDCIHGREIQVHRHGRISPVPSPHPCWVPRRIPISRTHLISQEALSVLIVADTARATARRRGRRRATPTATATASLDSAAFSAVSRKRRRCRLSHPCARITAPQRGVATEDLPCTREQAWPWVCRTCRRTSPTTQMPSWMKLWGGWGARS